MKEPRYYREFSHRYGIDFRTLWIQEFKQKSDQLYQLMEQQYVEVVTKTPFDTEQQSLY